MEYKVEHLIAKAREAATNLAAASMFPEKKSILCDRYDQNIIQLEAMLRQTLPLDKPAA